MRKRNGGFLIGCIVILLALIFLEPSYGWKLRDYLSPTDTLPADQPSLAAQNQVLQAQLAILQNIAAQLPNLPSNYIRAMIYSRYPFDFKNEILVNVGTNEGVTVGKAVVFQGILIGDVEKVFSNSALVETVFDNGFKMPVRIGSTGYDGLLTGGADPILTSIQKAAPITQGDIVSSADPRFPYGLPVAQVEGTSTSPDALFEQASLGFVYDMNSIQTVLIAQ